MNYRYKLQVLFFFGSYLKRKVFIGVIENYVSFLILTEVHGGSRLTPGSFVLVRDQFPKGLGFRASRPFHKSGDLGFQSRVIL